MRPKAIRAQGIIVKYIFIFFFENAIFFCSYCNRGRIHMSRQYKEHLVDVFVVVMVTVVTFRR